MRRTPSERLLSSARPLPEDQDVYEWRPRSENNNSRKTTKQALVQFPWHIPPQPASSAVGSSAVVEAPFREVSPSPSVNYLLKERADTTSPKTLLYTGDVLMPITSRLNIVKPKDSTPEDIWPVFRLMVSQTK